LDNPLAGDVNTLPCTDTILVISTTLSTVRFFIFTSIPGFVRLHGGNKQTSVGNFVQSTFTDRFAFSVYTETISTVGYRPVLTSITIRQRFRRLARVIETPYLRKMSGEKELYHIVC